MLSVLVYSYIKCARQLHWFWSKHVILFRLNLGSSTLSAVLDQSRLLDQPALLAY